MIDDTAGPYTVVLACQPTRILQLTAGQARGTACIRCTAADTELLPVGVIAPPFAGSGIAVACPTCVTAVLAPEPRRHRDRPAKPAGTKRLTGPAGVSSPSCAPR